MSHRWISHLLFIALASLAAIAAGAEAPLNAQYHLYPRDLIRVAVHDEPDVATDQRVDSNGQVSIPLLGTVKVAGLSLGEAQTLIASRYVEAEIFIHPEVSVSVMEYSPKEVMVLGQVGKQGKQSFPPEAANMSIVEAITAAGGLTRIAKGDGVRVTRKDGSGADQSFTVNVERLIQGRSAQTEVFMLQPGDVVFVPERVF